MVNLGRKKMAGYSPLRITGNETGLVQGREEYLLPDDAYPVLKNAYIFRERLLRKKGSQFLGRLQRNLATASIGVSGASPWSILNIYSTYTPPFVPETNAQIAPGSVVITIQAGPDIVFTDQGNGTLTSPTPGNSGTINYSNGDIVLIHTAGAGVASTAAFSYYPGLPVMGIRTRELQNVSNDQTVFFDQKYAYIFNAGVNMFQEFIVGTTWNAASAGVDSIDFFWSTNYWVSDPVNFTSTNIKLFWVTNNSGRSGALSDPPRITDGVTWVDFPSGTWNRIDATEFLFNWQNMLPFRGRMVVFNTWEGTTAASAAHHSNRIRWSTIGNPFIPYTAGPPAAGSWRDDIRGQGGFLDIPTSEDIVAIGFVRDNLVIYCERSTWQLRYTGRSIAPFQIERVNSELGAESPYSAVQFDTSLIGLGDKGVVECDSYKSDRIDIKIPDLVFGFNTLNNGVYRVHGIRDFPNRMAYWTIPLASEYDARVPSSSYIYPNTRLVYNYENDSWSLFNDTLTTLGTYQQQSSRTWLNTNVPWIECKFPWINQPQGYPDIVGGNQQGFIVQLNELTTNGISLTITGITGNTSSATVITSPNHNLVTTPSKNIPYVIQITGIPDNTPFDNLNNQIFGIIVNDANTFQILRYNSASEKYDIPQLDASAAYLGVGNITIRENFFIQSKKFNFLDEGQSIQMGYVDLLMSATGTSNPGAISMFVYLNYDDENASNILPDNQIDNGNIPLLADTFFNSIVNTSPSQYAVAPLGTKFWQRIFCPTRANFLTILYSLSNAQLNGVEADSDVQIDAQVLWLRQAGRCTQL